MVKQKTTQIILIWVIVITILGIVGYFAFVKAKPIPFIQIEGLYNEKGELLSRGLSINEYSIIGNVEGVKYVTFRINVKNEDKLPLNLRVKDLSPLGIDYAKPTNTIEVPSGRIGMWVTGLIDIEPFQGTTQDFCATIVSDKIFILRESNEITGCIDLTINRDAFSEGENPVYEVIFDSRVGDSSINPSCIENWTCSDWTTCNNHIQKRTCTDDNMCETSINKPIQRRLCLDENEIPNEEPIAENPSFNTNADFGEYAEVGKWIELQGRKFYYSGYSTYECLVGNIFFKTPNEEYDLCTRDGFEITERIYLDYGTKRLIFK